VGTEYTWPVDKLLTIGDPRRFTEWPKYYEFGLTEEYTSDLIRMATDMELHNADAKSDAVWAPLHAWRTLGQLRAEQAVEALLSILHMDDDWVANELPTVFGMIGSSAIPTLAGYLSDPSHKLYAQIRAANCLEKIGNINPEVRSECVASLVSQLERFSENHPTLNGFLISYLIDLDGQEAISVIRNAFEADAVDISIVGDLEDVEIQMSLKEERSTPKPNYCPELTELQNRLKQVAEQVKAEPKPQKRKIGRNDPCPCGSGKKYKKCCATK